MDRYGSDKPDLRDSIAIEDLSEIGRNLNSELIKSALDRGGVLRGLLVEGGAELSRSHLDRLQEKAKSLGAPGLIWVKRSEGSFKSSLKLAEDELRLLTEKLQARDGDLALLMASPRNGD